jgi:hypothetical protein
VTESTGAGNVAIGQDALIPMPLVQPES